MYIGGSLLFTFYLVESFARKRISDQFIMGHWGSIGYFIPRTIYLGQEVWLSKKENIYQITLFFLIYLLSLVKWINLEKTLN